MGPTWVQSSPWTLLSRRFPVSSKPNSRLSSMTNLYILAFFPISLFHLFITLRPIIFLFLTGSVPALFLSFFYHIPFHCLHFTTFILMPYMTHWGYRRQPQMHSLLQWKLLCSESVVWILFLSAYFNSSLLLVIPWHSFDATIIHGRPL